MNLKKISLIIVAIGITFFLTTTTMAMVDIEDVVDPNIPDSWYEAPKTASELGITEFKQAPMLDKRVEEGELPPVEERLPEDPPVVEPYEEIGKYGGRVNLWDSSIDGYGSWEVINFNPKFPEGGKITPNAQDVVPFLLKDWEYSDDYKDMTLHLRPGVKFSDGNPLTTDDMMFWWKHYANNKTLTNTPPEEWDPPLLDVTQHDDYTITFHYGKSVPSLYQDLSDYLTGHFFIASSEFMKKIHPDFVGKDTVQKMAKETDLDNWDDYYMRIMINSPHQPSYNRRRPVIRPYVMVERTETYSRWERNPYYPFVDTEGNQLPYIDEIIVNLVTEGEMAASKAALGEATFHNRHTNSSDIPLYKRNEEKEDYETLIYRRGYGSDIELEFNLSTKNLKHRAIYHDPRFRKAISLAIDRKDINQRVYFGEAIPMQSTVMPTHELFKEEYATAYTEYDPERAKKLLDEMGMKDINDDGYRNMPEGTLETMDGEVVEYKGEDFNPTLIYKETVGPVVPTKTLELVRNDLEEIGIKLDLKMVSEELHTVRIEGNDLDLSVCNTGMASAQFMASSLNSLAPISMSDINIWPGYVNWYESKGKTGMEPPEEIKQLIEYAETVMYNINEEERMAAIKKLIEAQAENLWSIGIIAMGPQPMIKKNKLKNVPKTGIWSYEVRYMRPMWPIQFYIEQ